MRSRISPAYDLLGRRTSLDSPDTGLTVLTFDAAGNLTRKVDPNLRALGRDVAVTYQYD